MIGKLLPIYLLTLQQINHSNHLPVIDQQIEDALREAKSSNAQLILHNSLGSNLEIVESIYKTVARVVPTSYVSLNSSILEELPSLVVSRATLILYLYIAEGPPDLQQREDMMRVISSNDSRPKVLLITILEEEDCNFEALLKRAWNARFIDVTILEISKLDELSISVELHRYDPFTDSYDQQPFVPGIEWFPNKLKNLHGYPVVGSMIKRAGHMWLPKDMSGYPTVNPDIQTADALATVMNFTFVEQKIDRDLFTQIKSREIDIVVTTLSLFAQDRLTEVDYTLPMDFETWCPVVPITYEYNNMGEGALAGIGVNCVVVLIIWGISRALKFDSHSWQPLKIFGLLISTTISLKPKGIKEKLVFFYVVLASSMVSASLYLDLTTVSIREKIQTDYKSFEELDKSGLTPAVYDPLMNVTFLSDDESFLSLKRKVIPISLLGDCMLYLKRHKNVTCFIGSEIANIAINMEARRGSFVMKICKNLCFAKPPIAYFMSKHTPYRDRMTEIIMRLQIAGIRRKWHYDFIGKFTIKQPRVMKVNSLANSSVTRNLLYILGGGFFMSLFTFFLEIFVHGMDTNDKQARRF